MNRQMQGYLPYRGYKKIVGHTFDHCGMCLYRDIAASNFMVTLKKLDVICAQPLLFHGWAEPKF